MGFISLYSKCSYWNLDICPMAFVVRIQLTSGVGVLHCTSESCCLMPLCMWAAELLLVQNWWPNCGLPLEPLREISNLISNLTSTEGLGQVCRAVCA